MAEDNNHDHPVSPNGPHSSNATPPHPRTTENVSGNSQSRPSSGPNHPSPQSNGNGQRPAGGTYSGGSRPAGSSGGPRPGGPGGPRPGGPRPGGGPGGPRPGGGSNTGGPRPGGGSGGPRPGGPGGGPYSGGSRPGGGPGGPRPGGPGGGPYSGGSRPGGGPGGPRPGGPGGSRPTGGVPSTGGGVGRGTSSHLPKRDSVRGNRGSDTARPGEAPFSSPRSGNAGGRNAPRQANTNRRNNHGSNGRSATAIKTRTPGPVTLPSTIVVKDLSEMLETSPNEIIMKLIGHGVFANINQVIDYAAAALIATDLGFTPTEAAPPPTESAAKSEIIMRRQAAEAQGHRAPRPPVVTVMGHVDHGKTSLLDAIRKTKVAAGEAGGITQHIGAYQVTTTDGRPITFLDTPGHEAFTAMRARGAKVGDVAIIVVAADDGVMPQTVEAIDHARAAQVPIVIALNKIDKPNANPDFVKQQLAEMGVVLEEYGGDVTCVPLSAKKGIGIEELLEMILLVADLQDLHANNDAPAVGTVLESRVDKNSGVIANLLVQDGTLKIGDIIVVSTASAKIRAMFDDTGERIKIAGPSTPISVLGLSAVPTAGDHFTVVADERHARQLIEEHRQEETTANASVSLDTLYQQMQQGKLKELNLLLKADVQGSLDAIHQVLSRLGNDQFKVRLIHEGVGNISETDVHLASASGAIVIGFNTKPDGTAQRVAQNEHVDIRFYDVIYKLVDDIEAALKGMLEPVYKEVIDGHAEVIQTFKAGKIIIGGCRVTDGKLTRSAHCRVLRGGKVVITSTIGSLRRGKDDAREVTTGFECGITIDDFNELQPGDIIETTSKVRV
jgi:translation initiation factor IF-2